MIYFIILDRFQHIWTLDSKSALKITQCYTFRSGFRHLLNVCICLALGRPVIISFEAILPRVGAHLAHGPLGPMRAPGAPMMAAMGPWGPHHGSSGAPATLLGPALHTRKIDSGTNGVGKPPFGLKLCVVKATGLRMPVGPRNG